LAEYLYLRHHSAVELVDRADASGLVRRVEDPEDRRVARVVLTASGRRALTGLSKQHLEELVLLASHLQPLLSQLDSA
jgi:DNA-binding MarR family transcriptional regulator